MSARFLALCQRSLTLHCMQGGVVFMSSVLNSDDTVIDLSSHRAAHRDAALIEEGFEAVYRAYLPYVAQICHRLLGRPQEVEDLLQEVFVVVYQRLHQLNDPSALSGWLATIATRKALKKLKQRRLKRFIGLDDHPGYNDLASDEDHPDVRVLLAEVFEKLDELPPEWRVVWVLRHVDGKNNSEIAQMCNYSVTTVKRYLARSREVLSEVFDEGQ